MFIHAVALVNYKKSSVVFWKQACISLLQSAEACHPLLTKWWKESWAIPSLLFVLSCCFWVIILTGFYFKNNCSLWIKTGVSDDNCCKPQNVSGCNHDQPLSRWWHFCCLSSNRNFPFLEKRGIHFFQTDQATTPLFFLISSPCSVKSSLLCLRPVLSFSRSLVQWSNKNTRKLRAVNSLIWNPALAYGSVNSNPTPKEQKCFWFWREQVWHISWTCIVHIYCVAQLVDSVELSSTVCCFRSRYYRYVFVRFLFTDCCSFTLRKLDI